MSNKVNYCEMKLAFVANDIDPAELMVYFNNFLKDHTNLESRSGRKHPIEIVESYFTKIAQCDPETGEEREFLDDRGNLILNDDEMQEAIDKGLIGESCK
ncbi:MULTISPECIES: hypothetical protein [Lysinibacillus]|uniref:hypothetical protein n=1 Tax=Lysinibacillus TaxID=400634 RepID=UPI0021A42D48|nr:hypothetical protein [Lysinibacillus capsici]MCT1538428.1 hypothetical protein [Lysinibacillus capsici]MCT1569136.1 hypothetical protein [Lysinibacillus capsici]MCT1646151.1 hypothetical protein [Lysinibacillus capsici]MCT1725343.1 hypothetical protein [Lysinibacillus capsici]MCT1784123.1 hypothetical protein [Lysinibacillus capsici]